MGRRAALARREARAMRPDAPAHLPFDALALYRDIPVAPASEYRLQSVLVDGGPIWPDFERQPLVRFQRRGKLVDLPSAAPEGPALRLERPCLWGGYAIAHFGHLVADHMTRVLAGSVARPEDAVLFLTAPGETGAPGFFWDILGWYGVAAERVVLVTKPLIAAELRCFAQAEPFGGPGPDAGYLDLLDRNAALRGLVPEPAPLVYVGRPGLLAQGKGGAAGEAYLIGLLQRLGVRVLDPASESLRAQLAAYAGAKALVFAEGSALHGRQLLGRVDQRIEVLNRRPGARLAEAALAPRCTALAYAETARAVIGIGTLAARRHAALGLSLCDLPALFAAFARCGLDLAPHWDAVAHAEAERADAESWLAGVAAHGTAARFDIDEARLALRQAGVAVDPPEPW